MRRRRLGGGSAEAAAWLVVSGRTARQRLGRGGGTAEAAARLGTMTQTLGRGKLNPKRERKPHRKTMPSGERMTTAVVVPAVSSGSTTTLGKIERNRLDR